jgi:uncharacterized protein (TIGR03083 family)
MTYDDLVAAITTEARALAAAAGAAGPDAVVPATPEWTMAKLVKHCGTTHRWAAANAERGVQVTPRELDLGLPDDPAALPAWFETGAAELVRVLRTTGPDTPAWSWGVDHHVRFWGRRMAHETSVHRWDAESAIGIQAPIAPDLAVDGIDERLENLVPSMEYNEAGRAAMTGAGESIHLHATDVDGEWLLRFTPEGFTFAREHAKGDLAVRGPAADLLLVLIGRRGLDGLEVFGDAGVLEAHAAVTRF